MTMTQTALWLPERLLFSAPLSFAAPTPLTASGHLFAFVGRVWTKDRSSKNIQSVGFRFGSVTKAGGSGLTVSLQHVSATAGPPFQPDGTVLQSVAIANGNAGFAGGTWINTGNLGSVQAVNHGDMLAVVIGYDGGGRLGADSVAIAPITELGAGLYLESGPVLNTSSWAIIAGATTNNVILGFDDGTFGTLSTGLPVSALSGDTFNNASNPEVIGLEFQLPFACRCDGAWANVTAAAGAAFGLVLYDGNSVLATASVTAQDQRVAATAFLHETTFPEQSLVANHTYRLGLVPTTANNVTLPNWSVNAANHLQAVPGGTAFMYNTAHSGTWGSPTATKRPLMGLRLSAVDDGTGSGAGGGHYMIGG